MKSGIRGKKGQNILFSRVEPLPGTRWLHAEAETKPNDKGADRVRDPEGIYGKPQRVVISFGPEHAPLEQKQVELAIQEAQTLVPKPKIIVFAAFQFDPEAAKDIDETDWPGVTLLKVQMNADLLTEDLKKKRASNESFWLIGQPDIMLSKIKDGNDIEVPRGDDRLSRLGTNRGRQHDLDGFAGHRDQHRIRSGRIVQQGVAPNHFPQQGYVNIFFFDGGG